MTLRQGLLAAVALVAALALGAATATHAAARGPTSVAANTATFTDPTGDATGGAPDITGVTVTSDAAGTITFAVTASSFSDLTDAEVYVDTDRSSATGSQSGCEFMLGGAALGQGVTGVMVMKWDGSQWAKADVPASLAYKVTTTAVTFSISKTDLGVGTGFSFWVGTAKYDQDFNVVGEDDAPAIGLWGFDLNAAPTKTSTVQATYKAVIGPAVAVPARAVAGKRFTVTFAVSRSDNGQPLTGVKMSCTPTINGKLVAHTDSLSNGTARLSLVVPKNAKGKTLSVKLAVTAGGSTVTKSASFRIG